MEEEMRGNTSPPASLQATDKLAVRETRHGSAVPKSAAPAERGGGQRDRAGWMDLDGTHRESKPLQGQAHLGLMDRPRHAEVVASGINRVQNLPLGPTLIFPTAAEAALIHVSSPDFALPRAHYAT